MRLIIVILFLSSIVANELVPDMLSCHDYDINLCENPIESQSEKESSESAEDEVKIDYLFGNQWFSNSAISEHSSSTNSISYSILTSYMEIHSPPPEIC